MATKRICRYFNAVTEKSSIMTIALNDTSLNLCVKNSMQELYVNFSKTDARIIFKNERGYVSELYKYNSDDVAYSYTSSNCKYRTEMDHILDDKNVLSVKYNIQRIDDNYGCTESSLDDEKELDIK